MQGQKSTHYLPLFPDIQSLTAKIESIECRSVAKDFPVTTLVAKDFSVTTSVAKDFPVMVCVQSTKLKMVLSSPGDFEMEDLRRTLISKAICFPESM